MGTLAGPDRASTSGAAGGQGRWPGIALLTVFVLGGAVGLALWGKWGFLIAFDAIRSYCF